MRNPKRRDDRARCHVFAADGPARNQTHPDVRQRPQTRGMTVLGRTLKLLRSRRLRLRAHQRLKRLRPASRSQRREIRFSSLIYLLCSVLPSLRQFSGAVRGSRKTIQICSNSATAKFKTGHSRTHNAGAGTLRLIESDMLTFGTAALTACAMLQADGGATCDPAHYHETGTSKLTYVLESNPLVSCDVRCSKL